MIVGRRRRNTGSESGDYLELWAGWDTCALRIDVEVCDRRRLHR